MDKLNLLANTGISVRQILGMESHRAAIVGGTMHVRVMEGGSACPAQAAAAQVRRAAGGGRFFGDITAGQDGRDLGLGSAAYVPGSSGRGGMELRPSSGSGSEGGCGRRWRLRRGFDWRRAF